MNPITRMVATPNTIDLTSILEETPFTFNNFDELVRTLNQAAKSANRCNLYVAYLIGKAVDPDMLMRKYGKTVKDLATMLNCSRATLYNYKTLTEVATIKEVQALANLAVPLKAVLLLRDIKESLGDDALQKAKSRLIEGDVKALKDFQAIYVDMINESLSSYNLLPGGTAPDVEAVASVEEEDEEEPKTPEELIIDAELVEDTDDEDDDDDEDTEEYKESETASAHERDAKNAYKLVNSSLGSLIKNYLDIINNAEDQTMSALDKLNIVINTTSEEDFNRLISELTETNQQALETCIKVHEVMKRYGYVKRKVALPENISTEKLFSNEC